VDHRRWGFEEADDDEYQELTSRPPSAPAQEPEESLVGYDPDRVVEVVVSPQAEVVRVRLSPQWRQAVDPRGLHSSVVSAANAATMRALARSAQAHDPATGNPEQPAGSDADESPLSTQDVHRLLDAVSAELGRFTEQLSAIVDHSVQVQSAGRHVQGFGQRGQVLRLDIDAGWAGRARHTEIESELLEVLRKLRESSAPRELAAGPTGSAISELMELAGDPQRLMRRLGMPT
jgi:DNA-binding protein YbaB